jgi:biofilm protein TabA
MEQVYTTKIKDESCLAEGHLKHIDIQYLTEGEEVIEIYSKDEVVLVKEYDSELDYALYKPTKPGRKVILKPYEFVILYPEDLHITALASENPQEVKKVVIKIPYNK